MCTREFTHTTTKIACPLNYLAPSLTATPAHTHEHRQSLEAVGIADQDVEMLMRIHLLTDKSGADQVPTLDYLSGLAPLCAGTHEEKLQCE